MNKRDVLSETSFGHRIAEDESETLAEYFVETDQWHKLLSGNVDVVYGPKGSGKSAMYSLLRKKREELRKRNILPVAGESVRGTPVFEDLVADPPASEEQFRGLWKLYFLSLLGTAIHVLKLDNEHAKKLNGFLEEANLISTVSTEWSLRSMLKSALDYARRIEAVSAGVKVNPVTGAPEGLEGKVTLRDRALKHGN